MKVCVPVAPDGTINASWGRASRVAVIDVQGGAVADVVEHEVGWDALHDVGTEGSHHARIARFLREHGVEAVVAGNMGPPMVHMLGEMQIRTVLGAAGDARAAAVTVAGETAS